MPDLKDKKAAVVLFLSFECPVSNSYAAELAQLAKDYGERGVSFVGICNDDSSAAQIAKQGQDFKIPFPVLKDERHAAADHFKAETTPEAFVLDNHGIVRYRGRIDNSYAARLKKNAQTTRHDLRVAAPVPVSQMVAGINWSYLAEPLRSRVTSRLPRLRASVGFRCAAHEYRLVA